MLSVVGRIFNELVSSKPGCHSFFEVKEGIKGSIPVKRWGEGECSEARMEVHGEGGGSAGV